MNYIIVPMPAQYTPNMSGIIPGMGSANESRRYYQKPFLPDRADTQHDPWNVHHESSRNWWYDYKKTIQNV